MRDPRQNPAFVKWFGKSHVVNADGSPRVMYHGTSRDFDTFDVTKIKANETDAPFNGFWFSADHETSPAFHNPTNIMPVYLSIQNPAPWKVWRKVSREIAEQAREAGAYPERSRTHQDELRYRLQELGYDGIHFDGQPEVDGAALERDGRVDFRNVTGQKNWLEKRRMPVSKWGDVEEEYEDIVGVVTNPDGSQEPIKTDLRSLVTIVASSDGVDVSGFDFNERVGTIRLPNGKVITCRKEPRKRTYQGWINTGEETDSYELYNDYVGHVTGYESLTDFLESHTDVWVCFRPEQIKSVYNRGTWDASNPKVTEQINEGLIPVPDRMFDTIMNFYRRELIWWARDRLKGRTKDFPELTRELRILSAMHWPEGIPKERYPTSENVRAKVWKFDDKMIPPQFGHLKPSADHFGAAIDWRKGGRSHGGWFHKRNCMVIYPSMMSDLEKYPRGNDSVFDYVFSNLEETIRHELRHAMQFMLLTQYPEQSKMHTGYEQGTPDNPKSMVSYYTSPVEFDPTIGSTAETFVRDVKMMRGYGKKVNVGKELRKFVGMTKTTMFDTFRTDPFFMVLKAKAPKRYRVAVRKFVQEVERLFKQRDLTEGVEIPATEYGYWISPKGDITPVRYQGHQNAMAQLHADGKSVAQHKHRAVYGHGWIRVTDYEGELNAEFSLRDLTPKAIAALKALVRERQGHRAFFIDTHILPQIKERHPDLKGLVYSRFTDPTKYWQAITKIIAAYREWARENPTALTEAVSIPDTDYGYWITDRGDFIPVGYQDHLKHAPEGYKAAYHKGWIRIVVVGQEVFIDFLKGGVALRAASSLAQLCRQMRYRMHYVAEIDAERDYATDEKVFISSGLLLAYVNENRRRVSESLLELYQEHEGSTFTHDGEKYDLNELLRFLDDADTYEVPLDALDWVLEWDEADPERLEKADVTKPVIVTWWYDEEAEQHRLAVIDGLHRVKKALEQGLEMIPGHYVDQDDLDACRVQR